MKKIAKLVFVIVLTLGFVSVNIVDIQAAIFVVTKTADTDDGTCDADCSFREAVEAANANAGADIVEFNIPTSDPNYNTTDLPNAFSLEFDIGILSVTDSLTIDGSTQTSFTGDTNKPVYQDDVRISTGPEIYINYSGFNINNPFRLTGDNKEYLIKGMGFYGLESSRRPLYPHNLTDSNIEIINNTFVNNDQGAMHIINLTDSPLLIKNNSFHQISLPSASYVYAVFEPLRGEFTIAENHFHTIGTEAMDLSISDSGKVYGNKFFNVGYSGGDNRGVIETYAGSLPTNIKIYNNWFSNFPESAVEINDRFDAGIYGFSIYQNQFVDYSDHAIINLVHQDQDNGITPNDEFDDDSGSNNVQNYPIITRVEHISDDKYRIKGRLEANGSQAPFRIEICQTENLPPYQGGCTSSLYYDRVNLSPNGDWQVDVEVSDTKGNYPITFTSLATNKFNSTSEFGPNYTYNPVARSQPEVSTPSSTSVFKADPAVMIAPSQTFDQPVYGTSQIKTWERPFNFGKGFRVYWSVGPASELWYRSSFNQAKILQSLQPYIVALNYDSTWLGKWRPQNLKLARSQDLETWEVLDTSVVDVENQTVAAVTKTGGWYQIVWSW